MLKLLILTIRVLCIGNSFSWDAVEQELVPLCDEEGIEIEVHNLYYGGCSLQQHAEFLIRDSAVYSHRVCTNLSPSPLERGGERFRLVKDTISLRQALRDGEYNFISHQQASHDSGIRSTYEPWLSMLIDTVQAYQPNAQLCWMQTWAYSQDATHPAYPRYHNSQSEMWDSIQACTRYVLEMVNGKCENEKMLLIPCGLAIQNARSTDLGDTMCRDGYHLDYIYGRYTASCVWFEFLTEKDVRSNRYKNPQLTNKQRRLTQKSAHEANRFYHVH